MGQSVSIVINRPTTDVFEYVMDLQHDAIWRTGVAETAFTSEEPHSPGSTGFVRIDSNGREMLAEWVATEYEEGVLARWRYVSGPLEGSAGYVCEPEGEATRFTVEGNIRPTGPLRVLGPLFRVMVVRQLRTDVGRLKAILEA